MPRHPEKIITNSLVVNNSTTLDDIRLTRTSISQGTSTTTGVTINSPAGFIYTFTTGTIATSGSASFNVSNSLVAADSIITTSIANYTGSAIPTSTVTSITQGSFDIKINNLDATNTLDGSLKLAYTLF
jgi:hypothetical protein